MEIQIQGIKKPLVLTKKELCLLLDRSPTWVRDQMLQSEALKAIGMSKEQYLKARKFTPAQSKALCEFWYIQKE